MEKNQDILKKALAKLPEYEPDEKVWAGLSQRMDDEPLQSAIAQMPQYEPDEQLWMLIVKMSTSKKSSKVWWYAAAAMVLIGVAGIGFFNQNSDQHIAFSQENVDKRLQAEASLVTDEEYRRLKSYCETETLVCNSKDYRRLQQEYEKLDAAAEQLQQAMGEYNTEPELVRQFSTVEQQKAEVLNQMAKMI